MSKTTKPNAVGTTEAPPNNELDLSGFDYANLTGDKFDDYKKLVASLHANDEYDFVLMRTTPVRQERYPGMKGSPIDFTGLKVKDSTPVHTSRMAVKRAVEYNKQIENEHSIAGHGKYYFLKK